MEIPVSDVFWLPFAKSNSSSRVSIPVSFLVVDERGCFSNSEIILDTLDDSLDTLDDNLDTLDDNLDTLDDSLDFQV